MSYNQSRSDRGETQYRKTGRSASFNQQRSSSGGYARGAGPTPATSSLSSNRSFKRSDNAQGGQSRVNAPAVNSSVPGNAFAPRHLQNGTNVHPHSHRASNSPPSTDATKPMESSAPQRGTRAVPKAPTSGSVVLSSESTKPTTPAKASGDASKAFPFQFGSLSPGFMNGMQIPARTSSAPPNLDEQKRDQARHDSSVSVQNLPTPIPMQQLPKKDLDLSNAGDKYVVPQEKKDVLLSSAPVPSPAQKSPVRPIPMTSAQMPFHRPPVPVQFGGPNLQIQPQGMPATSLQMPMPMPLPMINAPQVQQPVFVSGLQSHPMSHQGIMHQGQGLSFTTPMGAQLPSQLGHMGLSMSPPYPQQQGGKFPGPRKTTVKITHPDTHEELRLDKRSDNHSEGGSSSLRPVPSFSPSQPINYFPNAYNAAPVFFPSGSVPRTSSQMPPNSQGPRFSYPVSQGSQHVQFVNPSAHTSAPATKKSHSAADSSHLENVLNALDATSSASSGAKQITVKTAFVGAKVPESMQSSSPDTKMVGSPKSSKPSGVVSESATDPKRSVVVSSSASFDSPASNGVSTVQTASTGETVLAVPSAEDRRRETLSRSNSIKENDKKADKKAYVQTSHQVSDHGVSSTDGTVGIVDVKVVPALNVSESKADRTPEGTGHASSRLSGSGEEPKYETHGTEGEEKLSGKYLQNNWSSKTSAEPVAPKSSEPGNQTVQGSLLNGATRTNEVSTRETAKGNLDDPIRNCPGTERFFDSTDASTCGILNYAEAGGKNSELGATKTSTPDQQTFVESLDLEGASKQEIEIVETPDCGSVLVPVSKEKAEPSRGKNTISRGKKKMKEILQKADAAGTTSDLYMAYKGPEEKKETVRPSESIESSSVGENATQTPADCSQEVSVVAKHVALSKAEPDDWEDAADLSNPNLETSDDAELAQAGSLQNGKGGCGNMAKKYSRDFLLKFADQHSDLPQGFEITSDIADTLMNASTSSTRDSNASLGRIVDRQGSASRLDRRSSNVVDNDRWGKFPGPFPSGRDLALDVGHGGNVGVRPSQVANFGVLRNPRVQPPVQYAGGILSGPLHSMGPQGGLAKNNSDADRWQRASNFQQKGLIPSPRTPMQMMHRAEKKYEVGKVSDEEEAKQRRLKAILNKLTPQNFEKLFEQVKEVNIDNATTLTGVISQIFDKALMEPTFCEMYADFCYHLSGELPDIVEDNEKKTFKRLLLNKCQEEFERGEREEEEANKVEEGEAKQTAEEREEKRTKARRQMLGNIRLIGELYKKKMLTERIMHGCIQKLLGQYQNPDEENIEALCKLLSTIGEMIDHSKAKEHIDAYFETLTMLSKNTKLSSRVRFMLKDVIDLRKNKWQQRRKVEGPKKIEEVHRDAAQERQTQTSRLSRGAGINPSARRGPVDFSPRGSNVLPSPNAQMGSFRGLSPHVRGFGAQDVRFEDRLPYENRTLSVALPQRSMGDDSITLGPQGGLGRGMSIRGPPSVPNPTGLNGFSPISERTTLSSREDVMQRSPVDRFAAPSANDPSIAQDRGLNFGNRDVRNAEHASDQPRGTLSSMEGQGLPFTQNVPSEKVLPEERLRNMSMAAIKEFYSARDEEEVAFCIKELNSSNFHPTMICLWVTDSFERKDVEMDLLAKLLVYLVKSQDGILNQVQLMQGFESVLTTLEDAVNDAPKAAEFLGRIFGKVIVENLMSLREIGKLIHKGGEEPGRLLEIGLAGDVLGSTLQTIKLEKGEPVLNEIRSSSKMRLEDFRPPDPIKSRALERFV